MVDAYVGDYKVIRKIAEGSVGEVFEAIDPMRQRRAAIKCLRPEVGNRSELLQRFDSEAQTLALLVHPNIARVLSFIRQDDRFYLALEFVEGETLQAMLKRNGRIQPAVALSLFYQILRAVGFAHRIGVIHGDLKPANIMVTNSGAVRVMDFGIAHIFGRPKRTRAGYLVGTIQYMSPEQIRGEPLDARSDIYSLATLLYELIVGHVPFDSDSDDEIMRAQSEAIPIPPSLFVADSPEWLDAVLRRALAKSRSNRFQSVTQMAHAIGFKVEGNDRIVWTEQPAVLFRRTGRWMSSVSNPMLRTASFAFGSMRESLATASEISRSRYASIARVIRLEVEAINPIVWAKRTAVWAQRTGRAMSSSLFNFLLLIASRVSASLRSIFAGALLAGWKLYAFIADAMGLAVATVHRSALVWPKRAAVRLQRAGLRMSSVSNSVSATTSRAFGSLKTTLATTSEMTRNKHAASARVMRFVIAASHPTGWTKQTALWLQRASLGMSSAANSLAATASRMFGSLRTALTASGTSWKRSALFASLLIAVAMEVIFFAGQKSLFSPDRGPTSDTSLNDSVDKLLAQASRRPVTDRPPAIKNEPRAKVTKPLDKRPAIADKQLSSRISSNKEPKPVKTRAVERPGRLVSAGVSSEKQQTEQAPAKAPTPREPILPEKNPENNVAKAKLNVKWEN